MAEDLWTLRSQRLRRVNHQGDALRLGMTWTEEDLVNPQGWWKARTGWATREHSILGG